MINFAFHELSKAEAKAQMRAKADEKPDDFFTDELAASIDALIDIAPEIPEGGCILVSIRANVPLGGYEHNLMIEIGIHPAAEIVIPDRCPLAADVVPASVREPEPEA
jgi:hypothetical protein